MFPMLVHVLHLHVQTKEITKEMGKINRQVSDSQLIKNVKRRSFKLQITLMSRWMIVKSLPINHESVDAASPRTDALINHNQASL